MATTFNNVSITAGRPLSLRQLLPKAGFIEGARGNHPFRTQRLVADSRDVEPGDTFVAITGGEHDGHDHILEAESRGAANVVTERLLATRLPQCIVGDSRVALGKLSHAAVGHPSRTLPVIGITGTNGKTTTSYLIASILKVAGHAPGIMGTLGYSDGLFAVAPSHTTPSAPMIAGWLARMNAAGCTHAVMELSSHALAQHRAAGLELDVACITNVRRDHLDFHGTLAAYRKAKRRIIKHLRPEGLAVLNADDGACRELAGKLDGPNLMIAVDGDGNTNIANITATPLEQFVSEQSFLIHAGDDSAVVRTKMIGRHHVSNCLMATAVALGYGIDLATIVRGLEAVERVPGRLERVECGQPFSVFVDFAHTPDALESTLRSLRSATSGKLLCVYGAGGDRDQMKRPQMGRVVEELADVGVVTNDNPRSEQPETIVEHVLAGCRYPHRMLVELDRREAIETALSIAATGDTVVICGKGHETYQQMGRDQVPHDDRAVATDWLHRNVRSTLDWFGTHAVKGVG